jgi:hypothetical protein
MSVTVYSAEAGTPCTWHSHHAMVLLGAKQHSPFYRLAGPTSPAARFSGGRDFTAGCRQAASCVSGADCLSVTLVICADSGLDCWKTDRQRSRRQPAPSERVDPATEKFAGA